MTNHVPHTDTTTTGCPGRSARRLAALAVTGVLLATGPASWAAPPAADRDGTGGQEAQVAIAATETPFVRAAYQDFLGRQPSADELNRDATGLGAGTLSRDAFLQRMSSSPEWLDVIITDLYVTTLDRRPDAGGLAHWRGRLASGQVSVAQVTTGFYSSAEYYARTGGTDRAWVTRLYLDILGRQPDAAGLAGWVAAVPSQGRSAVTHGFVQSPEHLRARVDGTYRKLLGRGADASGLAHWPGVVAARGDLVLARYLAASAEYRQRAQSRFGQTPPAGGSARQLTDGTRSASNPDLSADGGFVAYVLPSPTSGMHSDLYVAARGSGAVSTVSAGGRTMGDQALSADGRWVAFGAQDDAGNLQVSVWDRTTGAVDRVTQGSGTGQVEDVSEDGRLVVFSSDATFGDAADTNRGSDLFVWDRDTGDTTRLTNGPGPSAAAAISADGRYVAFSTRGGSGGGTSPGQSGLHLLDRRTGGFTRIASDPVTPPSLSADGAYVAFTTRARLVSGDTDNHSDVYTWNRSTGAFTRVTRGNEGSFNASISADGRFVAFDSLASDLVPGDTYQGADVFVWTRASGAIAQLTRDGGADPSISADGAHVAYQGRGTGGQNAIWVWSR